MPIYGSWANAIAQVKNGRKVTPTLFQRSKVPQIQLRREPQSTSAHLGYWPTPKTVSKFNLTQFYHFIDPYI